MIQIKRVQRRQEEHGEMESILAKVAQAFHPAEIMALAKAILLSSLDLEALIVAAAQKQRLANESPAQAFVRFVTRHPNGIELYRMLDNKSGGKVTLFANTRASCGAGLPGRVDPTSQHAKPARRS